MHKPGLSLFFILIIIFSCQKETPIPDTGRKLVINGLFTTDSLLGINISRSMFITDSMQWFGLDTIYNAKTYVYQDDLLIDSLIYIPKDWTKYHSFFLVENNYRSNKLFPKPGKEYKIIVKVPGIPDVVAKTNIPEIVKINKIDTSTIVLDGNFESWESNKRFICNIGFTDPVAVKNYYLLYVYHLPSVAYNYIDVPFVCNDPVVEENLKSGSIQFGVAFSDKNINGKTHSLAVTLNGKDIGWPFYDDAPFLSHKKVIYFRLYSITGEYFKYIQSLNLFFKNFKNPLTEPTQVFSNINGGYGIFAGAAVSCDSIVFKE